MVGRSGGRGRKAPYETTHVRVPKPMKREVERLIARFHAEQLSQPDNQLITLENTLTTLGSSVAIAQNILIQKKSARVSMQKLLTAIYAKNVTL